MNKIAIIIRKNFLILVKSKWWALIFILGPLLIIFLTGIAFDNLNEYRINIGIYSPTYTEMTNSFIAKLNSDQFRTVKTRSAEECIDDTKIGLSHTCVIFPQDLALGSKNKDITIFIDYSKLNLAWIIKDRLFSRVEARSTEITKTLTQNILSNLLLTRNDIKNNLVLLDLVKLNEKDSINNTNQTYYLVLSINTTVGLNVSDIDRLDAKVMSLKVSFESAAADAEKNIKFAENLINLGSFSENDRDSYRNDIYEQKIKLLKQKEYVSSLYSPQFSGSVNNTIDSIRNKVNKINYNANATNSLISRSKDTLYNINQFSLRNVKLENNIDYSMKGMQKNLDSIDQLNAEDIASPVTADIKPLTSYNTYLNYLFPTLMAISIMLAALLLSAIVIVMELNNPAYFRNFISSTSDFVFFFTSYLTNLSLIGVQIFIMLLISMLFFFAQIFSNILTTLAVCFLIATFFILLGMGIGYLFKREQMAILAATFSSSMLLFLSNVLLPIENMPEFFLKIVQFNPFIISVSLLRKTILFNQSILDVNEEIFYLVVSIMIILLVYAIFYFTRSRRFQNKSVLKKIFR